jgi:hypothetical protein
VHLVEMNAESMLLEGPQHHVMWQHPALSSVLSMDTNLLPEDPDQKGFGDFGATYGIQI